MSLQGREIERPSGKSGKLKRKAGAGNGDEFGQAIAKIAVAQICESVGFQTFQQSALDKLADVAVRYVTQIGKTAHFYANIGRRTECNALDIIHGLEDLNSAQSFAGPSDFDRNLSSSAMVKELVRFADEAENIPFIYSVPSFPVAKETGLMRSFYRIGEAPPWEHVPAWLPTFPDLQSYLKLSKENEDKLEMIEQPVQHDKIERCLLDLQHQNVCNGKEGPSSVALGDGVHAEQGVVSNPFFAAPLQCGEKEISVIVPPAKVLNDAMRYRLEQNDIMDNHVSALGTCSPAIELTKNNFCATDEEQKQVLSKQRPAVQFKIGVRKKSLATAADDQSNGFWVAADNETNAKKVRAERILKQSMDSVEMAQL